MRVIRSIHSLRQVINKAKRQNKKIGFVPTMGALHDGHRSLLKKCRRENNLVVLSIFVNPQQFAPHEDYAQYPRDKKKDELLAKKENVDIIFYPSEEIMYPKGYLSYVTVESISDLLCGKSRPGHFKGVATIVAKLLNCVSPDILYLGQKDAQQAYILKKMIADLNFPVKVKICPIIRENDGLAMSSRNRYLTQQERKEAPILFQSLQEAKRKILAGERNLITISRLMESNIKRYSHGKLDYIECVDPGTLAPLAQIQKKFMIALAVKLGKTRLIDNIIIQIYAMGQRIK
ncbi:MAG TPA: pantoate--beta-alanine ligase [Candidatus Omnitrophica bacterium]|nr:MAG: pantoate--beta-alanine ligase [Omnitrophica WOR_2 bacterium GWA2_45_18]HBR15456.1 pantoate--beta-alanine ligase [Candidatus Omnitrophota bacterium]